MIVYILHFCTMCTIVRISVDSFINIRNNPALTTCKSIQLRSETLLTNHKCFTEVEPIDNFDRNNSKYYHKNGTNNFSKWKNSSTVKKLDNNYQHLERLAKRPTIVNNANSQREFISLLNKITHDNEVKIITKLKDIITYENISLYIPIIWDMMLRCPEFQNIYINVIDLIRRESNTIHISEFKDIWIDYKENKKWIPDTSILPDSSDYDEFCDYVKWKKRSVAAINGFMLLSKNNIVDLNIIKELTPYIIDITHTYINDKELCIPVQLISALLEQIIVLLNTLKVYKCDKSKEYISKFIKNNEHLIPELQPLIKFKIYDIIENLKQFNLFRTNKQ